MSLKNSANIHINVPHPLIEGEKQTQQQHSDGNRTSYLRITAHRVRSVKSTITWFLPPFHSGLSAGHGVPRRLFTCRNRQASS